MDEVWLITCDQVAQRGRLLARGSSPEDADRRIAAQHGLAERLEPAATRVIDFERLAGGDAGPGCGGTARRARAHLSGRK